MRYGQGSESLCIKYCEKRVSGTCKVLYFCNKRAITQKNENAFNTFLMADVSLSMSGSMSSVNIGKERNQT